MLQQTQVSRVLEKFEPFMLRFPSIAALAAADEEDVLAEWSGLGYYRRARLLHAAAKTIVNGFGGVVPARVADLESIPGIGRYTAGSLASIVFGENAGIVDGNVTRVLLRLDGVEARHGSKEAAAHAWPRATELADVAHRAGVVAEFNEGLMELGATICTPRNPGCGVCPMAGRCMANREGLQDRIPGPKVAVKRRTVTHSCVLVLDAGGRVLLEKRPAAGMWANMWQPPTMESENGADEGAIQSHLGIVGRGRLLPLADFQHTTTHRVVRFVVFRLSGRAQLAAGVGRSWFTRDEAPGLALSNAHRRIIDMAWT